MLGTARRGYFVEGLGGAQFALPGRSSACARCPAPTGELSSSPRPTRRTPTAPSLRGRSARRAAARAHPGAYVLLRDGEPLLYVERGGKGILRLVELEGEELVEAIDRARRAGADGVIPKLAIERVDGEPVIGSGRRRP